MFSRILYKFTSALLTGIVLIVVITGCSSAPNIIEPSTQTLDQGSIKKLDNSLTAMGFKRVENNQVSTSVKPLSFKTVEEVEVFFKQNAGSKSLRFEGVAKALPRGQKVDLSKEPGICLYVADEEVGGVSPSSLGFTRTMYVRLDGGLASDLWFAVTATYNPLSGRWEYSNQRTYVTGLQIGWVWQQQYINQSGSDTHPDFEVSGLVVYSIQVAGINLTYSYVLTVNLSYNPVTNEVSIFSSRRNGQ